MHESNPCASVGKGLLGLPFVRDQFHAERRHHFPNPTGITGLGDMMHYTCDQCGRVINGQRYSVNIEIRRTLEADPLAAADLDQDNLQQIADEISMMDSTSEFQLPEPISKTVKLDLCAPCTRRFESDPLARETRKRFNISPN